MSTSSPVYIHCKAIPGADGALIAGWALLADRISVNIEAPLPGEFTDAGPRQNQGTDFRPYEADFHLHPAKQPGNCPVPPLPKFAPAGQKHPDDCRRHAGKRSCKSLTLHPGVVPQIPFKKGVFSAYIPVQEDSCLPALDTKPPLLREHRLYQADWLLRFYGFDAKELLDERHPNFNPF